MSSATITDKKSINSMSFCPNPEEIKSLIEQSKRAESIRQSLLLNKCMFAREVKLLSKLFNLMFSHKGKLLSKLFILPGKYGLCPDSLNPNNTILAKKGKESTLIKNDIFSIIDDKNMPLGSTSCGPNGVLFETEEIMNLFHKDTDTTKELLNKYISFRNENLNAIFEMFVNKIKNSAITMLLDPTKKDKLSKDLQGHYSNVMKMFEAVLGHLSVSSYATNDSSSPSLSNCGIGCVSFCQTWLRNTLNTQVGDAQFSVMSPHFQTRFYVSDDEALKRCGVTQEQINSYVTIINNFDAIMSKDYGIDGGGQAFVNLDELHSHFLKYMDRTIILGLAGTRSLTEMVSSCPENNLLICRHCFSISTRDKANSLSHNQKIEDEEGFEKNYYTVLSQLREQGKVVESFTQGSNYGNTYISRYSGIKLQENSCVFEGNPYDKNPDKDCIAINNELADIFNNCNIKDFIIDNIRTTESRKGFYGCFLHDVKVYFVSCNFNLLKSEDIIISKELYINNKDIISDYRQSHEDILINEHIVNPDKIKDYSNYFNIWLRSLLINGEHSIGCDYVCSDPGPGYKTDLGLKLIAQDVDDTITLKLLEIQNKPIKKLIISDETSLYSRSCFAISNFSKIINEINVLPNSSTELSCNKKNKEAVINKNLITCNYINSEILKKL